MPSTSADSSGWWARPGRWGAAFVVVAMTAGVADAQEPAPRPAEEPADRGTYDEGDAGEGAALEGNAPPSPGGEPPEGDEREPSDRGQGDRAAAESLLRVGEGLMELGQYDEACAKLEQSIESRPSLGARLLLGECYERRGRLAAAWAAYRQAAAHLRAAGDARSEVAATRALQIEPKVPKLTLLARQRLEGMTIQRDEITFGVGVLGVPLAIDPGPHLVTVEAEGFEPWSLQLTLSPSERRTVEIPPLKRIPVGPEAPPAVTERGRGPLFYAGVVSAGAGAASLTIGALLAASASRDVSAAESSERLCGPDRICTPEGRELVDRADAKAVAATTTLALGAAAVAAGFVLVLVDPGAPPEAVGADRASSLELRPLPFTAGGGVAVGGRF